MKKLMIAAAMAATALALNADVSSANIVGYSSITIPAGWSIFTPVFKNVDGTTFTLEKIEVLNQYGKEFDNLDEDEWEESGKDPADYGVEGDHIVYSGKFIFTKLRDGKCVVGDSLTYQSIGGVKWGKYKDVQLTSGEGVLVNNQQKVPVILRISGEVELIPGYSVPAGWSIFGNNTPVGMTLGDISLLNRYGKEFDNLDEDEWEESGKDPADYGVEGDHIVYSGKFVFTKLRDGKCVVGDSLTYQSIGGVKWGKYATTPLAAGEAVLINNQQKVPVLLQLKSPVPAK